MSNKKQIILHNNIPGKFIPRDDSPSASVLRTVTNPNRFNSKMAELLASSSSSSTTVTKTIATSTNEREPVIMGDKSSQDDQILITSPEGTAPDSSRAHSKLLHRRIVTMLETVKKRNGTSGTTSSTTETHSHIESKSQPITFGQLRQAMTLSSTPTTVIEENSRSKNLPIRSNTDLLTLITPDKQISHGNVTATTPDARSDLITHKLSSQSQTNKERFYYSSSLEQLLERRDVVPLVKEQEQSKQNEQQQSKTSLTVDDILADYYTKVKLSTTSEKQSSSQIPPYSNNTMSYYMHPSTLGWNSSSTNQHVVPPPPFLLNEQSRNRPPPPSYSSSVASGHRPPSTTTQLAQHLIRPPVPSAISEQIYPGAQITQHLLPGNSQVNHLIPPPLTVPNVVNRPPPPRYEPLSSNDQQNHPPVNPPQAGFDREFSRLLYGKDGGKHRHQRQKRKAFSDPVKKSVEEAGRSIDKTHRRLTTHLHRTDTVKEEEESGNDTTEVDEIGNSVPRRRFQRQSELVTKDRESAKKAIVPANPVLKRRIPSFLRIYSQVSPSTDPLLQWNLFSLSELVSFDAMMRKLYKDENLERVQSYENYRALLRSTLASKTLSNKVVVHNKNDDDDAITSTAL